MSSIITSAQIITAETTGAEAAISRIKAHENAHSKRVLDRAALAGATIAALIATDEMAKPKSGEFWRGNRAPSSAKGEYPAIQWGALVRSFEVKNEGGDANTGQAVWRAGGGEAPYAGILEEYGSPTVQPRPFMRPTVDQHRDKINEAMAYVVKLETDKV